MDLILPDTNVLIMGLANQVPIASHLSSWISNKTLVLSSIVIAEFLCGATEEEEHTFSGLYPSFPIIPVDLPVAQLAAHFRKKYHATKTRLLLPDCLIAAQAKISGASLATLNPKDFPPDIPIFKF